MRSLSEQPSPERMRSQDEPAETVALDDSNRNFSAFVRAEFEWVWRLRRRIGLSPADADDAAQQGDRRARDHSRTAERTFIWDALNGTRTLDEILAVRGVDATGWEFGHARALSGNGKVLLGRGQCGGVPTLYRVVLSD